MNSVGGLNGLKVLLVEDESLVSMLAEDVLMDAGCEVVLVMTLLAALDAAEAGDLHAAVLDVNLGAGTDSFPVARRLEERSIPYVFATGYGAQGLTAEFAERPVLQKPYLPQDLIDALTRLVECKAGTN